MDKNAWNQFWEVMPPEIKLLLGTVCGAIILFFRNRATKVIDGFSSLIVAVMAGYALTFAICFFPKWNIGDYWFVGTLAAYMSNSWLGGMDTLGNQIKEAPIKFLTDVLLDAYDQVKLRIKPKE